MPDNAVGFWDGLNQNGSSPSLAGVDFAVLALGDRNYGDTFCLAGKKLDERLTELGANRLAERVDCDVEYDAPAADWMAGVFAALGATEVASQAVGKWPVVRPADDAAGGRGGLVFEKESADGAADRECATERQGIC